MIQEDYVCFETAKLLKEKGFDEQLCHFYTEEGLPIMYKTEKGVVWASNSKSEHAVTQPTQQMAMKWLREVHNFNVEPYATAPGFRFQINKAGNIKIGDISGGTSVYDSNFNGPNDGGAWDTYEDTVEAAIKYCLENLI